MNNREPLRMRDIFNDNQQLIHVNRPIYYDGIRVVGQPQRPSADELVFNLMNGEEHSIFLEEFDPEQVLENMTIDPLIPKVSPAAEDNTHIGAGKKRRRTRKHKKYSKKTRKYRKKSRRHSRR